MKHRNEKDKQMDKDKGELSKEEKKLRKKARKSSDSMRKHEGGHRDTGRQMDGSREEEPISNLIAGGTITSYF